jgi:hypothetical protein
MTAISAPDTPRLGTSDIDEESLRPWCPRRRRRWDARHTKGPGIANTVTHLVGPSFGHEVFHCCFCGDLAEAGPGAMTLAVTAAFPPEDVPRRTQNLYCHASCLASRLHNMVPFDPELFDG